MRRSSRPLSHPPPAGRPICEGVKNQEFGSWNLECGLRTRIGIAFQIPTSKFQIPASAWGTSMKVLIAGATGALGVPLVRALVRRGHEVVGLTRSSSKRALLEPLGARVAVGNALDADDMTRVVAAAAPTHIV